MLANYLYNLLFTHIKKNKKRLIKRFISILKPDTKAKYLKDFDNSNIKIQIYRGITKMGINIENIVINDPNIFHASNIDITNEVHKA